MRVLETLAGERWLLRLTGPDGRARFHTGARLDGLPGQLAAFRARHAAQGVRLDLVEAVVVEAALRSDGAEYDSFRFVDRDGGAVYLTKPPGMVGIFRALAAGTLTAEDGFLVGRWCFTRSRFWVSLSAWENAAATTAEDE